MRLVRVKDVGDQVNMNRKVTGFVVWVTCEIKDEESEWNKMTQVLATFAEFANVGGIGLADSE